MASRWRCGPGCRSAISSSSSSIRPCCSTATPVAGRPLITEALRGEGAILVDAGKSVTAGVHPMGDLARDVVAAAIDAALNATGDPCVYLDARNPRFRASFPTVTAACRAAISTTRQPIPVVPGAHYSCGGVVTDVHGRTDLAGLAAGEVARTGMALQPAGVQQPARRLGGRRPGRQGRCPAPPRPAPVHAAAPDPSTRRALPAPTCSAQ